MANVNIPYRWKMRGGSAAALTAANEVLLERELCWETDTGRMKVGDGVTAWASLEYFGETGGTQTDAVPVAAAALLAANTYTDDAVALASSRTVLTPTTLAADTHDYAPTRHQEAAIFRLSASAAVNLTGLQGGSDAREVVLMNVGANNIVLSHESASSTAAYRWLGPGSASVTLRPDGWVRAIYDATSARWRIMGA